MAADLRTPIAANEGYLLYSAQNLDGSGALYGHERSGETKTTSPGNPSVTNTSLGYDWSSVQIDIHATTVQHAAPENIGKLLDDITTDFEFANQIFAQAGITVRRAAYAGVKAYNVVSPVVGSDQLKLITVENHGAPGQVNVWYVDAMVVGQHALAGITLPPADSRNLPGVNDGILIAKSAMRTQADTFAHELVHYLYGSVPNALGVLEANDKIYRHYDNGIDDDQGNHAENKFEGQNLMNLFRPNEREPLSDTDDYPQKSAANTAPSDPLLNPYTRGVFTDLRRDQLNDEVYFDWNATNDREWTEPPVSQIKALYPSAFVTGDEVVHEDYAAVADLKWVEDSWDLENQGQADVTPRAGGERDSLRFTVPAEGAPAAPSNELGLGNYTGDWFNVVDVL
jgi:hypothetical protein